MSPQMMCKASNFGCSVNAARPPTAASASPSTGCQIIGRTRPSWGWWRSSYHIFWPCPCQKTSPTTTHAKNVPQIQRTRARRKQPHIFQSEKKMMIVWKLFPVFFETARQKPAVWGAYTLTLGKIWDGSGFTSHQATMLITAWAPAPTSGTLKTNILRFSAPRVCLLLVNFSINPSFLGIFLTITF